MSTRKKITLLLTGFTLVAFGFIINYSWRAFPIITGYSAKNLASAVFLQERIPDEVIRQEFSDFPFTLASFHVDTLDASVTASIWGVAKKKAIYRKGWGCTLVNEVSENELRKQEFNGHQNINPGTDSLPWPQGNKIADSSPTGFNPIKLQQAIDNVMRDPYKDKDPQTRAVVILHKGQIIGEKYAPGFDQNTVMLGWSISKSITGTLIGLLVKQGKLDLKAPAPVPEWKNDERKKITLEHLLQQTSGLDFKEDYTGPSEVTNMLFKAGDMAAFTAKRKLKHEPGTVFNYSSGNSNVLSRIIRHTVGEDQYAAFPYQALFHRIGIHSMLLEPDASGTFIGSSYSYATARDFARFGLLYLNNGKWNNEQILPESWVKQATTSPVANKGKNYGYQFWLNGYNEKDTLERRFKDVPSDMFYADGFGGQDIYIIPSRSLVVVRLGRFTIDENKFLREILQALD